MTVLATIYDATSAPAGRADTLLVDTNVWAWAVYAASRDGEKTPVAQIEAYTDIVTATFSSEGRLVYSALSESELGNVVDKTEHRKWAQTIQAASTDNHYPGRKDFRADARQRARVLSTIRTAIDSVRQLADDVPTTIDHATTQRVLERAAREGHVLDVFDMYLVEAVEQSGAHAVLTHDSDFATVPGLRVITAHPLVLAAAQASGQLTPWPKDPAVPL